MKTPSALNGGLAFLSMNIIPIKKRNSGFPFPRDFSPLDKRKVELHGLKPMAPPHASWGLPSPKRLRAGRRYGTQAWLSAKEGKIFLEFFGVRLWIEKV